jgi:hypothetical protein
MGLGLQGRRPGFVRAKHADDRPMSLRGDRRSVVAGGRAGRKTAQAGVKRGLLRRHAH